MPDTTDLDTDTLDGFLKAYAKPGKTMTIDLEPGDVEQTIVVRCGNDITAVLVPMRLSDHLCVDVHSFIDGQRVTGGVMGMTEGRRFELTPTGSTSHGFNSVTVASVLVGDQADTTAAAAAENQEKAR
jgi:hypothetical protein